MSNFDFMLAVLVGFLVVLVVVAWYVAWKDGGI